MTTERNEARGSEWTIQRVLTWASDDFKKRGLESARLDAELLLTQVLGVDRVRLIVDSKRPLVGAELTRYRSLIQRRRTNEPMAYILGAKEFFGRAFRADRRALIPRPDTETLVEVALDRTRLSSLDGDALDLCTGSGCVAVTLKKERPTWRVTAIDISEEAIALARENALRLNAVWGSRFLVSDLTSALRTEEKFDLVTANPPYIPSSAVDELDVGIREFEPRVALDGGADGFDLIRRVVQQGAERLRPGGVFATEVMLGQAAAVRELLEKAGLESISTARDYAGIERVVSGRRHS